ncbi:hypothetical protein [Streptomyces sp. LaPpAH-108]|uniref:hypothetical protein n=1 Tax=Streptomyces sp. LaPpAH-108 TaxID=1155714 RepID=UPI0003A84834|nr:hypothetical protein [Streptomyces sp. LaPpAH-108]
MADEHDEWLDLETSERLLNGEPPRSSAAQVPDEVTRVASLLADLAASAAPAKDELPGEDVVLAAFRAARAGRASAVRDADVPGDGVAATGAMHDAAPPQHASAASEFHGHDAGVVRIGAQPRCPVRERRPRWRRPVRMALAAAVAVGTLGGVAVAAGSGVLPGPFRQGRPDPGASVSAAATPGRSRLPSSPGPSGTAGPTAGTTGSADPGDAPPEAAGGAGQDTGKRTGSGAESRKPGARWRAAVAACRELRAGREPEAGHRRALEGVAGGSDRVKTYCAAVLSPRRGGGLPTLPGSGGLATEGPLGHFGDGRGSDGKGGFGDDDGKGDGDGDGTSGSGSDSGSGDSRPRKDRDRPVRHLRNGLASPVPSTYVLPVVPTATDLPTATPSPTFSTL